MDVIATEIPDVLELAPKVFGDERGFFLETWNERVYREAGIPSAFVQDNWSRSRRGILRGLHYQMHQPQGKLVRVTRGAVFDVAVDLRRSSPTFGRHVGRVLSEENKRALWIPPGFAHGFLVISDEADFVATLITRATASKGVRHRHGRAVGARTRRNRSRWR